MDDTIAAITTPPGRGGVGIVRISGADLQTMAAKITQKALQPRVATLTDFLTHDGESIDTGLAIWFPAPHSYTGEDVLELQGHGGPAVLDLLLARSLELGARLARPGEFTERAYLNDKLDLAQAEAVADLIEADSAEAARAAIHSLQGDFSKRIQALVNGLTDLRVHVEAAIDFPEEEIDFLADGQIQNKLESIIADLADVRAKARQGSLLREGMTLVIVGRPNVGKSSLLNRLAGYDAAIVTDIAGTTRDVLRESISIDGLPLHIIDTAGLHDSADPIEQEGIRRARAEIDKADRLLLIVDDTRLDTDGNIPAEDLTLLDDLPTDIPRTLILNKCDLSQRSSGLVTDETMPRLRISAKAGLGIDLLTEHLEECAGYRGAEAGSFSARRRHLDALTRAAEILDAGHTQLVDQKAGELLAEELRSGQNALSEITGEFSNEALLGKIFSSFCIGK